MITINSSTVVLLVLSSLHIGTTRAFSFHKPTSSESTHSSLFQSATSTSFTSSEQGTTSSEKFYEVLKSYGRDIDAEPVQDVLKDLKQVYSNAGIDARISTSPDYDGDWFMETHPTFPDLQGRNKDGDALYTMGRLTYNMIQPSNVLCSVQKITQHIHKLSDDPTHVNSQDGSVILPELIPKRLREELEVDASELRSYRTDVHFTVESSGVQGVLQMDGYTIPNPTVENRYSIWFTGGRCYALNGKDKDARQKWRDVFGTELKLKKREKFQLWMAKLMMGAQPSSGMLEDDSLQYVMKKPIGGHNVAYQQVLYLDDETRITEGNRGTVVVVSRI
ncbi:hypothetical protein CTEN210_10342 [Chaetoceros tenuissimus]|uniref:Uncharacterized protein n=1 Tax=Chaetoceros tenuissimus TaxID=426638 RepID=A0AAD3H893_9STRA|nr:hypothetical protein CTEN210_10342 [Chaetoceros tenuissimus]